MINAGQLRTALAVFVAIALGSAHGAVSVTASKEYVDRKTTLHANTNGTGEVVGYYLGTQTDIGLQPQGDYAQPSDVPTNNNQLVNGAGYITGESSTNSFVKKTGDTMTGSLTIGLRSPIAPTNAGPWSLVVGSFNKASGTNAIAVGTWTIASGNDAHAEGHMSQATSPGSHAEGNNTRADGAYSHAEGSDGKAIGLASHVEGSQTEAGTNAIAAHAEGVMTKVFAPGAHVEGLGLDVPNPYAPGTTNRLGAAAGFFSHVEGIVGTAQGFGSHVEGFNAHDGDAANASSFVWQGYRGIVPSNEVLAGYFAAPESAAAQQFFYYALTNTPAYVSKGQGTFCINPVGGTDGFYVGDTNLTDYMSIASTRSAPIYCTSSTSGLSTNKVANPVGGRTITNADIATGIVVVVKFTDKGSDAGKVNLKVGDSDFRPICRIDGQPPLTDAWQTGEAVPFVYDGAQWLMLKHARAYGEQFGIVRISSSDKISGDLDRSDDTKAITPLAAKMLVQSLSALTERGDPSTPGFSAWTITAVPDDLDPADVSVVWGDPGDNYGYEAWYFELPIGWVWTDNTDQSITSLVYDDFTATRTTLPGYQLGSDTNHILASEAEAEALRIGKTDKSIPESPGDVASVDANGNLTQGKRPTRQVGLYCLCNDEDNSKQTRNATPVDGHTFTDADLVAGARVCVWFLKGQARADEVFLKVGTSTAKRILRYGIGANLKDAGKTAWRIGEVVDFVYDGTYWQMLKPARAQGSAYGVVKLSTESTFEQDLSNDDDKDTKAATPLAVVKATTLYTTSQGYRLGSESSSNPNRDKLLASEAEAEALRTEVTGKADKPTTSTNNNLAALDANGNLKDSGVAKSDVESLVFAQYYPDGNVKSAAEFTNGIKYDAPNTTYRTITVKPFCDTGTAENDNSSLVGRVVIPPFVDDDGNGYISDDGTRYSVVGVSDSSTSDLGANANLTAIVTPDTVTTIGTMAFFRCTELASVSLPAAISIGNYAFGNCSKLTSVSLPSAESIGGGALSGCDELTTVSLQVATSIGINAFYYSANLTSVTLPVAEEIGSDAFNGCTSLATVSLPSATSIGGSVFRRCTSLTSVSLPAVMGTVNKKVFYGCTALASVDFGATPRPSVPTLGVEAFDNVPTSCKIIVPYTQYDEWKAASGWNDLQQEFVRHAEVTMKLDSASVAPPFSTDSTYSIGTPVTYNGRLYTAKQAISTPEAWTPEHWEEQTLAGLSSVNVLVDDGLVPIAGPGTSNTGANSADAVTYLADNFLNWTCDGAVAVYRNHPSTSYTYDTDLFTNRFAFIAIKFGTSSTNAGSFTRTVVFPSAGLYRIDAYVNAMASRGNKYPVVVGMSCNGGTVTWESAGIGNLSDTKVVSAIVSAQAGSGTVKLDSDRASALAGFTLSRLKITYIGPLPAAQP